MLSIHIKNDTIQAHQLLEKIVVQRLKSIYSYADYAELLKYFYAYFSKLEEAIAPFITDKLLPDYKERRSALFYMAILRS